MSDIKVSVTNAGAANVAVSNGSTVNTVVGYGGSVNVALGSISPGNATVVSGTLTINSTTTLAAGTPAYVVNNGTAYAAKLDIGIPAGAATNVTVGKVSTLSASSNATVTGTASGSTLTLDFGIPAGASGSDGTNGTNGTNGITPSFSIGTVSTLAAGSAANVTLTTANGGADVTLDFGIPAGADGVGGASLSNATPSNLGTASAGSSSLASRADHIHTLPSASDLGLATVATSGKYSDLSGAPTIPALASATPQPLGVAFVGDDSEAARADHVHDMPTASDVGALALDDAADGGDYVGVIVVPTPTITITAQPANQGVTVGAVSEYQTNLPSGIWGPTTRVNSQWMVSGYDTQQADYIAVSSNGVSFAKRVGLPSAGQWQAIQYANGVYATQYNNTVAYSSDAITWASTSGDGTLFAAGGKFIRAGSAYLYHSTNAATWTQGPAWSGSTRAYLGYDGSTFFAARGNQTWQIRASADGESWGDPFTSSAVGAPYGEQLRPVSFGGATFIGRRADTPLRYQSGTFSTFGGAGAGGGEFATDGTTLVYYRYSGTINGVNQGAILTSTNGSTFTVRPLPDVLPSQGIATLIYTGSRFVLLRRPWLSEAGRTYYTSVDGIDWVKSTRQYISFGSGNSDLSGGTFASQSGGVWNSITFGGNTTTATFSASAYYAGGAVSYQWQVSTDGGTTWTNVADATSSVLSLTGLTVADSGKRYRVIISATGTASVNSNSATLTVS